MLKILLVEDNVRLFSGFWAAPQSRLKRRHRAWLWLMVLWLGELITLLLAANPIPAYDQLVQLDWDGTLAVRTTPVLLLLFPLWMVGCILLSIDVLRKPAEVDNANTKTARQRAFSEPDAARQGVGTPLPSRL